MIWIKCNKQVPSTENIKVLVFVKAKNYEGVHMGYYSKNNFYVYDEKGNHDDFITHWMPLPSSPKL